VSDVATLDQTLTVGEQDLTVRFTMSALTMAERLVGSTVPEIAMQASIAIATRNFPFDLTVKLACAGLEGARRKHRFGGQQWTATKVEDLLDDADDFVTVAEPVFVALDAAVQRWFPEWGDEADPQMAAGVGTDSTPQESEPESTPDGSGT
jgi:hypothetical protein